MRKLKIGFDVGFSVTKRTCGVSANLDVLPSYGSSKMVIEKPDGTCVFSKRLKLSEGIKWLAELRAADLLDDAVIVVDGMIGPAGPPTAERHADHGCTTGGFTNRAVAASVVGGGQK